MLLGQWSSYVTREGYFLFLVRKMWRYVFLVLCLNSCKEIWSDCCFRDAWLLKVPTCPGLAMECCPTCPNIAANLYCSDCACAGNTANICQSTDCGCLQSKFCFPKVDYPTCIADKNLYYPRIC